MIEKIKIIKIIKVGAMELNFIISKNGNELYVYSDFWPEDKTILNKFMHCDLVSWTSDKNSFKKIESEKTEIISNGGSRYSFKGKIIEINEKYVVVDAIFLINILHRDFMNKVKVGDYIAIEGVQVWAYNLRLANN